MTPSMSPPVQSLGQLLTGIAKLPAAYECEVSRLELDSRRVGPGSVFMACKGYRQDGRKFIAEAIARGASAVLAEAGEEWQGASLIDAVPVVAVDLLPEKMAELAARFYANPGQHLQLIGVTGTNGKTSCCQLVSGLLTATGTICGVIGTLGYGLSGQPMQHDTDVPGTTPDAVSLQRQLAGLLAEGAEAVVMEVSSHGLHQHRVIVDDYSISLFTNFTRDHLDFHGSMEAYGATKRKLFSGKGLRLAILNADDPYVLESRAAIAGNVKVLTWGIQNPQADINATTVSYHSHGQQLTIATPWGEFQIQSSLLGKFNTSNLLGVLALVLSAKSGQPDFNPGFICEQAGMLKPVSGRMQLLQSPEAPLAVVVDYAHTPDALEKALQAMRQHCHGRLWCVFGCGGDRDRGKRPQMAAIAEHLADQLVLTDDNPRYETSAQILAEMLAGLSKPERVIQKADRAEAIKYAIAKAAPGDCILIAGKGHESYQEVAGQKLPFSDIDVALEVLGRIYPARIEAGGSGD